MATFITEVHMERAPGASHEHIGRVKLQGYTHDLPRSEIISRIFKGEVFYTYANSPTLVYVARCPHCSAGDYLTTHPDSTTLNNLLELPRY
jgi:hypothetical protein